MSTFIEKHSLPIVNFDFYEFKNEMEMETTMTLRRLVGEMNRQIPTAEEEYKAAEDSFNKDQKEIKDKFRVYMSKDIIRRLARQEILTRKNREGKTKKLSKKRGVILKQKNIKL